jgi:hypothetical protein
MTEFVRVEDRNVILTRIARFYYLAGAAERQIALPLTLFQEHNLLNAFNGQRLIRIFATEPSRSQKPCRMRRYA